MINQELLPAISTVAAVLSTVAAILSGYCAVLSYKLSRQIQDELKSDERLVAGVPIHPNLTVDAHSNAVIQCTLFNKSKRKAYVNSVSVYDHKNKKIDVTWSDAIDECGNPKNPCQLIGIVDSCSLFIQRGDVKNFDDAIIYISHSFSETPMIVPYDYFKT